MVLHFLLLFASGFFVLQWFNLLRTLLWTVHNCLKTGNCGTWRRLLVEMLGCAIVQPSYWISLTSEQPPVKLLYRQFIIKEKWCLQVCVFADANKKLFTQVSLAQMEYQLPRLTRMWSHLERQAGGQVKGMGEKQIEVDKRILRDQVNLLYAILLNFYIMITLGARFFAFS